MVRTPNMSELGFKEQGVCCLRSFLLIPCLIFEEIISISDEQATKQGVCISKTNDSANPPPDFCGMRDSDTPLTLNSYQLQDKWSKVTARRN